MNQEVENVLFEQRKPFQQYPNDVNAWSQEQVEHGIEALTRGQIQVCVGKMGVRESYVTQKWVKEIVLAYFRFQKITLVSENSSAKCGHHIDKIPLRKFSLEDQVRVVPPASVRIGSFVGKGAVVMPSFVNIGARFGENSMVDTWATVGSCAQIGNRVHLSGGVGIGGVLEPVQSQPVVIEDDVFVGSRCVIVEGVWVGYEAIIGAGVILTASTPIIDVRKSEEKTWRGWIPPRAVVIPGMRNKSFPSGEYGTPCALIIGERSDHNEKKVSLNEALHQFDVPV